MCIESKTALLAFGCHLNAIDVVSPFLFILNGIGEIKSFQINDLNDARKILDRR